MFQQVNSSIIGGVSSCSVPPVPPTQPFNHHDTKPSHPLKGDSLKRISWIRDDYESLPNISELYPIERTSTLVECSNPLLVAERIAGALQKLSVSIVAEFSDASLRAETLDHTEFNVRMYKYNKNNRDEILVEVQRSKGESFEYAKYASAILASARGEDVDFQSGVRKRSSSASLSYIPGSIFSSCHPDDFCGSEVASVNHIAELIQKDRDDAVSLGMASLLLLTDCERSLVSQSVAQAVLHGNDIGPSVIKDFIYNHVSSSPTNTTLSTQEVNVFESRQQEILHNKAIAILGNSLYCAVEAHPSNLSNLLQTSDWTGKSGIIDVLLSELSNAEHKLHDAYQAARCITILLESTSEVKQELLDRNVVAILNDAHLIGVQMHALLAAECKEALSLISDM